MNSATTEIEVAEELVGEMKTGELGLRSIVRMGSNI